MPTFRRSLLLCVALAAATTVSAAAAVLAVDFSDALADPTGDIDVVAMSMIFDDTTGEYALTITASDDHPFQGTFRVNVSLYDVDLGSTECGPAFLQDTLNDFDFALPEREVVLAGTSSKLLGWSIGDRVATSGVPFGSPDCTLSFSSSVVALPYAPPFPSDIIADGDVHGVIYAPFIFGDGFEDATADAWSAALP